MGKGRGGGKTPERVVELIRKAVAEKSQSAVARESGLTLLTVQRYLKGIGEPTTKTLEKLSDYFNVSVPWLRGDAPWDLDAERRRIEFLQLPNEETKELEFDRLIGGKGNCIDSILNEVESDLQKYGDLLTAFSRIPPEDGERAIEILRQRQKQKMSNRLPDNKITSDSSS